MRRTIELTLGLLKGYMWKTLRFNLRRVLVEPNEQDVDPGTLRSSAGQALSLNLKVQIYCTILFLKSQAWRTTVCRLSKKL